MRGPKLSLIPLYVYLLLEVQIHYDNYRITLVYSFYRNFRLAHQRADQRAPAVEQQQYVRKILFAMPIRSTRCPLYNLCD